MIPADLLSALREKDPEPFPPDIDLMAITDWGQLRDLFGELIAEVEAKNKQIKELQDLIDKPPEDADWVADYHLLQSALDGPIIDAARKWHAAYRKAQNSNLMRAKEVERLRAALAHELDLRNRHIESLEARIKELEARIGREQVATMQNREAQLQNVISSQEAYIKLLEAAFLRSNAAMRYYQEGNRGPWPQVGDKFKEPYLEKAREKLERIKEGNG